MILHSPYFLVTLMLLNFPIWALGQGVSSLTQEVARDLFSPTGLFLMNERFRKLFLDARLHGARNPNLEFGYLDIAVKNENLLASNKRLYKKLTSDYSYKMEFTRQIRIALKHGEQLASEQHLLETAKSNFAIGWKEGKTKFSEEIGYSTLMTAASFALGSLPFYLQDPFSLIWPALGAVPSIPIWRYVFIRGDTKEMRNDLVQSKERVLDATKKMNERILSDLNLPLFPPEPSAKEKITGAILQPFRSAKTHYQSYWLKRREKAQHSEISILAYLADGSPLMVMEKDLLAALKFRNSITVYHGQANQLKSNSGIQQYPSTSIKGSDSETLLAPIYAKVLLPNAYREISTDSNEKRLETLKLQLSSFIAGNIPRLASEPDTSTRQTPCAAFAAIASKI